MKILFILPYSPIPTNTGNKNLKVLWTFPTDCWEEVEYIFKNSKFNFIF